MLGTRTVVRNSLGANFNAFFRRINPSPSYTTTAARAQAEIRSLVEARDGSAGALRAKCFIQGSYGRQTAIHTINDVDIVALCGLRYSPKANRNTRNQIFDIVADSIADNKRYTGKVHYSDSSICIKVQLAGIKIEVLPGLRTPHESFDYEPFFIFYPAESRSSGTWEKVYTRYHQQRLTEKNQRTTGWYIPMVKIIKHLRSTDLYLSQTDAVSFQIECLLYAVRDTVFAGNVAECIEAVLGALAGFRPDMATISGIKSPCKDKLLFSEAGWSIDAFKRFHDRVVAWHQLARQANTTVDRDGAIARWQELFGDSYFPRCPEVK